MVGEARKGRISLRGVVRGDAEEKLENEIIFGLRLGEGVDRGSLDRYLGAAGRETEKALAPLLAQGYAREDGGRLKLTFDGFCLSNEVISLFFPTVSVASAGKRDDDKDEEYGFLRNVEKPSRYTGGELYETVKDDCGTLVRAAIAFPEVYDIGMSNVGLQILYNILNNQPDIWAERVFMPLPDMEEELRKGRSPSTASNREGR